MAREYYHPTDTPRLFYKLNKAGLKIYVAKFQLDNKNYKRTLTSKKDESIKMLNDLMKQLKEKKVEAKKNDRQKFLSNKADYIQDPQNMTLTQLFKDYMHVDGMKLSPKEQSTRISRFNKWILPTLGKLQFKTIKYKHIQALINNIDDSELLDRKTQTHIKSAISALFSYAIKNEYFDRNNPAQFVEILPFDNHRNLPIDKDGVTRLFKSILEIEDKQYRLMFIFLMHGRRLKEVLHLEYEDINFIDDVHVIPAHKSKTKKTQMHMMTNLLSSELKQHLKNTNIDNGFIFLNPNTDLPYVDISRVFKRLKDHADITQNFQMTDFRHIIGTFVRKVCDLPLEDARDTLGHGSIKTTERFYEDRFSQTSKDTVQAVLNEVGV